MKTTKTGLPRPIKRRVLLRNLTTDESRFQPRSGGLRQNHVAQLCDVMKRGEDLDALSVWEDPETLELIVADGHHRLEALRRTKRGGKVLIELYRCDYKTAQEIPLADNRKNRLPLSYVEKANWAWRLTVEGSRSKAEVGRICGVSEGTVANQRRTKGVLEKANLALPDIWIEAQLLAQNGEFCGAWSDDEREAHKEAAVAKADEKFGADLTEFFQRWPGAAMELVKRCAGPNNFSNTLDDLGWIHEDDERLGADYSPY